MMCKILYVALGAVLASASVEAVAVEQATIGNATIVVKTVTGMLEGEKQRINLQDDIYHNELIETGPDSASEVTFLDETTITLGANSRITLDRFIYDPNPDNSAFVMTATAGVFRFVSGNLPKKAYVIHTPVATIGIRGTVITVVIVPVELSDGRSDMAVNVTVESGIATITNCAGISLTLARPGQSTTVVGQGNGACTDPTEPGPQPAVFGFYTTALQ